MNESELHDVVEEWKSLSKWMDNHLHELSEHVDPQVYFMAKHGWIGFRAQMSQLIQNAIANSRGGYLDDAP